jgi:ribosomal protein L1
MDIKTAKQEALETAIDSLARYKFMMFGYWAAIWVHLNNLDSTHEPNPFKKYVHLARQRQQILNEQAGLGLEEKGESLPGRDTHSHKGGQ